MGVCLKCNSKKSDKSIDMGYGCFWRLRATVARMYSREWFVHYTQLFRFFRNEKMRKILNEKTKQMLIEKKIPIALAEFCLQSDCDGQLDYRSCKELLTIIGEREDDYIYGFEDLKNILKDCVKYRVRMVWY